MRNMNKVKINDKISEWNRQHTLTLEQRNKLIQEKVERAKIFTQNKRGFERVIENSR